MIKCCSVIYNPGYGGNFFTKVLSLSKETVPYLYQDIERFSDTEIENLQHMSAYERYAIIKYQGLQTHVDWHYGRLKDPNIFYEDPRINNFFQWSILGNHFDNLAGPRLDFIKKMIHVDLDLSVYQNWITKSNQEMQNQIGRKYVGSWSLTDEQLQQINQYREQLAQKFPMCDVSMTNILSSTDGFVHEYVKACEFLNITVETDVAVTFYREWHEWRFRKVMAN